MMQVFLQAHNLHHFMGISRKQRSPEILPNATGLCLETRPPKQDIYFHGNLKPSSQSLIHAFRYSDTNPLNPSKTKTLPDICKTLIFQLCIQFKARGFRGSEVESPKVACRVPLFTTGLCCKARHLEFRLRGLSFGFRASVSKKSPYRIARNWRLYSLMLVLVAAAHARVALVI